MPRPAQIPQRIRPQQFLSIFVALAATLATLSGRAQVGTGTSQPAAATQTRQVEFGQIREIVNRQVATRAGYQPGDLITQEDVQRVVNSCMELGWEVPDSRRLVSLALPSRNLLIRQYDSEAGRKFMRQVAQIPGGYNHLDRLQSIGGGKQMIRDLSRRRGGAEMIRYLSTTQGGKNLGTMLGSARRGVNLNKPTDRLYTAAQLVATLEPVFGTWAQPTGPVPPPTR